MPTTRYTTVNGVIVSENRNGALRDYLPNTLGSTLALLDNTQTQTDQWSYSPYGESTRIIGSTPTPMLFVGNRSCRQDSTGATSYMQQRVLDMRNARLMTQDPSRFRGAEWNLYRYAANNPVLMTDPTGLMACSPRQGNPLIYPEYPLPSHPAPYGQYCGPQTKPGMGWGWDMLDHCCGRHDHCWQECNAGCTVLHQTGPCCRKCTHALCICAKAANCNRYPLLSEKRRNCEIAIGLVMGYACVIDMLPKNWWPAGL